MSGRKVSPCVLTIAGSDSGGNAGVQADLRAFHCHGLHGCTVFTALTAQNPLGVRRVLPVPADFIADQLDAVLGMYNVRAVKTGMLATADAVVAVAERLRRVPRAKVVVDPVMVATSGAKLIADDARATLRERLLPRATLITPNLPEAAELLGRPVAPGEEMRVAARELARMFGCAVLVKGGHAVEADAGDAAMVEDVLFDGRRIRVFAKPVLAHPVSTHGTGCTLSAALAAALARGDSLVKAVESAKNFVYDAIRLSYHVGKNCGVLGIPRER